MKADAGCLDPLAAHQKPDFADKFCKIMLFNSISFIVLFAAVLGLYYWGDRKRQNLLLLAASYLFYGWWDWRFCALLFFSTALDYACALQVEKAKKKEIRLRWLLVSLSVSLGVLGFFKYFGFFARSLKELLTFLGVPPDWPTLNIILPVGISFYTFQTMSYVIDVYRGDMPPARRFTDFALYVSFFPQLVAGPIERAGRLLPQFENRRIFNKAWLPQGLTLMLMGYVKKMAIADFVAPLVTDRFLHPASYGSAGLLAGLFLFSIQIYGDFSGYSDIARGSARLLGIELMPNFRQPYFSRSVTEFWRRWHISLSTWLRDYLYIPLGGNRCGTLRTYANLLVTMLLGGLWHGANWTFVIWGGLHGIYLSLERKFFGGRFKHDESSASPSLPALGINVIRGMLVFSLISVTWVFFRSQNLPTALDYLGRILEMRGGVSGTDFLVPVFFTSVLAGMDLPQYISKDPVVFIRWHWLGRGIWLGVCFLMLFIFYRGEELSPFIYFQF